jgi:hypothetical protein
MTPIKPINMKDGQICLQIAWKISSQDDRLKYLKIFKVVKSDIVITKDEVRISCDIIYGATTSLREDGTVRLAPMLSYNPSVHTFQHYTTIFELTDDEANAILITKI